MMYCCKVCPHAPSCADLAASTFARPEEITMTDFFNEPDVPELTLQRPTCPVHFIELPISGECEQCL